MSPLDSSLSCSSSCKWPSLRLDLCSRWGRPKWSSCSFRAGSHFRLRDALHFDIVAFDAIATPIALMARTKRKRRTSDEGAAAQDEAQEEASPGSEWRSKAITKMSQMSKDMVKCEICVLPSRTG